MRDLRQPPLPDGLATDAAPVLASLSTDLAPAILHAGAVAAHGEAAGFLDPGTGLRAGLERIAKAHPALEYWGHLAAGVNARAEAAVTEFWRAHPLPADDHALIYSYPLGDAWQALSAESVQSRALCQTPPWAGQLLGKLAYDRALEQWASPRLIDPACGTGHLLVEGFLAVQAARTRPGSYPGPDACLDAVHGVELEPHAAATAAWRLLTLWGRRHRQYRRTPPLAEAPLHLAVADALLDDAEPLLAPGRYHAVIANPPYITGKDASVNAAVRARWPEVCHRRFPLALPFHARMMELLVPGGWCAQLTANSFQKREFGRPYVERFLARFQTAWIIDTSGAYIPGHGTPTVVMSHRKQSPGTGPVHVVSGLRGEPYRPEWPGIGHVAETILTEVDRIEAYDRFARRAAAWHRKQAPTPMWR